MNTQELNISKEIWEKDQAHLIHPYTNYKKFNTEGSVVYAKGEKHWIFDADGNKYLDGIAGLWCVNVGHGREDIAEIMAAEASKLAYYNTFEDATSIPAAELAAKLAEIAPENLNHVFFGTGGSMANDTAIKMAHYYFNLKGLPKKKKVISRDLAYHGSTFLAHTLTGIHSTHIGFDLVKDLVHYVSAPYTYRRPAELTEEEFCDFLIKELEDKINEVGADEIACFIAEPILGAGGVLVPPKGYHKRTWELCQKNDILYISDEVVTAFGRLGEMIASESIYDVKPDILVMAKGISSGYIPLGATMISDEIFEVISQPKEGNPYFSHGFTYSGHPLACAVGLKNIEIMENEHFCEHVQNLGPYFETQLASLSDLPIVGDIRGSKFMLCVECVKDKNTKEGFADEVTIAKRIYYHAKERGLIVRPLGSLLVLSPPLTFDKDAIDECVYILRESILASMEDLIREGIL
ncbi:aminotransferase [Sediminitomix flava]|uniref:Adenosylmethionine-8-amino-7-oxononanoate aminotransferase n=1 Tax=Sediminitomix flava TaxID=379075 RepID=A0A315ZBG8_SEDFL|nr:aminotransferase [Sediminitomix flava]PWJ42413.1 adenosylmethionine-8-amino-7-oxononanoate aminotransferase [Sediminitomix flava]